jgi:hypothetical protein
MEIMDMTFKIVYNMKETKEEKPHESSINENANDAHRLVLGDPYISKTKGREKESTN